MADETRPAPTATAGSTGERPSGDRPAGERPSGERSFGGDRPDRGERRPPRPGGGGREGGGPGGRKYFRRKKVCKFCTEKIEAVNYKDVRLLAQFVAESGKIVPRRLTGYARPISGVCRWQSSRRGILPCCRLRDGRGRNG